MKGSVYKRCQCPVQRNARGDRLACKKDHGSWFYVADAGRDQVTGKRRQVKLGGFEPRRTLRMRSRRSSTQQRRAR
jgi:hypothetical protein